MDLLVLPKRSEWKRAVGFLYLGGVALIIGYFTIFLNLSGPVAVVRGCVLIAGVAIIFMHFRAGWHEHARKSRLRGVSTHEGSSLYFFQIAVAASLMSSLAALPIVLYFFEPDSELVRYVLVSSCFLLAIFSLLIGFILKLKEIDRYTEPD